MTLLCSAQYCDLSAVPDFALSYLEKFSMITVKQRQDQSKTCIALTHVYISQSLLCGTGHMLHITQNTKAGTDFWSSSFYILSPRLK